MYVSVLAQESSTLQHRCFVTSIIFLDYTPGERLPGECNRVLCGVAALSALQPRIVLMLVFREMGGWTAH